MFKILQALSILAMILTATYGAVNYHRVTASTRWIVYQLAGTSVLEVYATCYSLWYLKKVAFPVYHFLNPIEFLLYSLFFYELTRKTSTKRFILVTITALVLFSIGNTLLLQPMAVDNSNAYLAGAALMVVFSLLYYYELYQKEDFSIPIIQLPDFWIVTGIFFLYAGSFFVMGFIRIISAIEPETAPKLYIINLFLNILLYAMIFYGIRCHTRVRT
jgi:hypothetical protein